VIATHILLRYKGILLLALLFCALTGTAQDFQISGTVVDGKTSAPVPFATIAFIKFRDSSQIGTVTNAITTVGTGVFTFSGAGGSIFAGSVVNAGTLSWSANSNLNISAGGTLTNNGTFTRGTGRGSNPS
jgi:hypothetical protein